MFHKIWQQHVRYQDWKYLFEVMSAGHQFLSKYIRNDLYQETKKPHMLWKHPTSYSYHSYSWVFQKVMVRLIEQFLISWPWSLTYDLDLPTWPRYPSTWPPCKNSSLYVSSFGWDSETDRHTDTQTHTRCQNYYTHHVRDVGCKNDTNLVEDMLSLRNDWCNNDYIILEFFWSSMNPESTWKQPSVLLSISCFQVQAYLIQWWGNKTMME